MRPVAPRVGLPEITLAEDQLEFSPIVVALHVYGDGTGAMVTRWRLDDAERAQLAAGADLYLCTLGSGFRPVMLTVGAPDWVPGEPAA